MSVRMGSMRSAVSVATTLVVSVGALGSQQVTASVDSLTVEDRESAATASSRWIDEDGYVRLPASELQAIAADQTEAELAALLDSGAKLNLLLDPATDQYLAAAVAVKLPPLIQPAAITQRCGEAGRATSTRYVGTRGLNTCFSGRGVLDINLPNTYYMQAGAYDTTWSPGLGGGRIVWAGYSVTLTTPESYTMVSR